MVVLRGRVALPALLMLVALERTASAHAVLIRSEPPAGTVVAGRAPSSVRLFFNESVEPGFSTIRVLDRSGRRYDRGSTDRLEDGTVVAVALQPLPRGAYTVVWRVNSVDGHQIDGYFGFGVAAEPPDETAMVMASSDRPSASWAIWRGSVRGIGLAALCLWIGGLAFVRLAYAPAGRDHPLSGPAAQTIADADRRLQMMTVAGAGTLLIAETIAFVNHSAVLTETSFLEAATRRETMAVLTTTNYGTWWIVRMMAAVLLFLVTCRLLRTRPISQTASRQPVAWIAALLLAALMLVTWPLTGHAGAVRRLPVVAVASDWVHLMATVIWTGGVASFATLAWRLRRVPAIEQDVLEGLPRRFSRLALACVLVLAATGAYNAWLHVPRWSALTTTAYGRALLGKLLLLIPILALAGVNRRHAGAAGGRSRPEAQPAGWARRMGMSLAAETALLVAVLGVVSWLTSLPPATAAARAGQFRETATHGDSTVQLTIHPNLVGLNHVTVLVRDARGTRVARPRAVSVFVRSLDTDSAIQSLDGLASSDGSFNSVLVMPHPGRATVSVQVTPETGDAFVTEFETYFTH